MQNFHILASLCSSEGRVEPYTITNPEDRFSCIEVHLMADSAVADPEGVQGFATPSLLPIFKYPMKMK